MDSKPIWDRPSSVNETSNERKLTSAWVPSHLSVRGNEASGELERRGSSRSFVGADLFFGITRSKMTKSMNEWMHKKSKHEQKLQFTKDATWRFRQEEEETPVHILYYCAGLPRIRFLVMGLENRTANCYINEPLSKMVSLINRAKLESVF